MKKECTICGRKTNRTYNLHGYKCVCGKHMHQIMKYGKPLDSIARTNNDLNDYKIKKDIVYFNLYNQKNIKINEFYIDLIDIEKVKYHKWRMSGGHVITGLPSRGTQRQIGHIILDLSQKQIKEQNIVVDHIDGNPLNNTRANLRICTQSQNTLNKSYMSNNNSGFIGVSYRKDRNRYDPEIRLGHIRCHLGYTTTLKEAVYKRYCAEQLLFKDFANHNEQAKKKDFTKDLPHTTKLMLQNIVKDRLSKKKLWQSVM